MTPLAVNIIVEILLGIVIYLTFFDSEKLQKFWGRFEKWNPSIKKQRLVLDKLLGLALLPAFAANFFIIFKRIFEK